jgi:hypothetical protein
MKKQHPKNHKHIEQIAPKASKTTPKWSPKWLQQWTFLNFVKPWFCTTLRWFCMIFGSPRGPEIDKKALNKKGPGKNTRKNIKKNRSTCSKTLILGRLFYRELGTKIVSFWTRRPFGAICSMCLWFLGCCFFIKICWISTLGGTPGTFLGLLVGSRNSTNFDEKTTPQKSQTHRTNSPKGLQNDPKMEPKVAPTVNFSEFCKTLILYDPPMVLHDFWIPEGSRNR